jgi:hypothetical protein
MSHWNPSVQVIYSNKVFYEIKKKKETIPEIGDKVDVFLHLDKNKEKKKNC